jgi:hypothetical protein
VNGLGAIVTGVVLLVCGITKTTEGAWIILLLIPLHVFFFRLTRRHYDACRGTTHAARVDAASRRTNVVLVPISGVSVRGRGLFDTRESIRPTCERWFVNV